MLLTGDSVIYFKIGSMEDSDIQKNVERELVSRGRRCHRSATLR